MKIDWKTCIRVGISIFVLYLCIHYWSVAAGLIKTALSAVSPLLIGGVMAYILNILMSFYERHIFHKSKNKFILKSKRAVSLVTAILTLVAVIALVIGLIVPQLKTCVMLLIDEIPLFMKKVTDFISQFEFMSEDIIAALQGFDWKSKLGEFAKTLTSGLGSVMDVAVSAVSSVVSVVTSTVLAVIFAIYLLLSKDKLFSQVNKVLKKYVKESIYVKGSYIIKIVDDCFHKFIVGQCTEAVILGVLCAVGMLILRLPYALMMGAVTAFTALIPVVGALIGGAVGAFLILMESPTKALIFLIFIILLQQIEGDLIYPKVVGNSIGLPGIWVFVAVTLGAGVMGVFGMMIAVPMFAAAYKLLRNELNGETPLNKLQTE